MKVLLCIGSRADKAAIEAVYQALLDHKVDATLSYGFDTAGHFDIVVLEGDRWEVLEAAVKFYKQNVVIVHLGGGDLTEGSKDDCMRHAITKLSHLHFPTNFASAKRIIQMGEDPLRVRTVGEPGIDKLETHGQGIATKLVGVEDYILMVWHPNTLARDEVQVLTEVNTIVNALEVVRGHHKVLVIGPNNDAGALSVIGFLEKWADFTGNKYVGSLPRDMYLTVLKYAKCLVGNSSSGYYEAPSLGTPVLDIGDRQKGRDRPFNVDHVAINQSAIEVVLRAMLVKNRYLPNNPYQTNNAADEIAKHIAKLGQAGHDPRKLLRKSFYTIKH